MEEGKWKKVTVMEGFETENVDVLSSEDDPWAREERESSSLFVIVIFRASRL